MSASEDACAPRCRPLPLFSLHLGALHIQKTLHTPGTKLGTQLILGRQLLPSRSSQAGRQGQPRYFLGLAGNVPDSSHAWGLLSWAVVNLPLVSLVDLLCSVSPAYKAYEYIHSFTQ